MISNCHNKRCESCGKIYDANASGSAEVRIFTFNTDRSIADVLPINVCPACAECVKNLLIPTGDILVATKYASNKEFLEPCGDCEVKTDDTDMG